MPARVRYVHTYNLNNWQCNGAFNFDEETYFNGEEEAFEVRFFVGIFPEAITPAHMKNMTEKMAGNSRLHLHAATGKVVWI